MKKKRKATWRNTTFLFPSRAQFLAITFPDPDHSKNENRSITFGQSQAGRFLVVAHTERGEKIRIISARLMTKQERKIYEEG
ncbi:protein of unknown function DUF497 [Turneriella parva DSM 21527]|uniref:BrnT family toxin n=1 Tax=Turneriella parva (strain ATCC BAA-1111 / DSM 21527 / NCTC 11395 / H) TaxID=869212 RepID=I4B4F5_TURPD|nr:protein of unknown function DUF497 [Turneriella parva DSM 21527]